MRTNICKHLRGRNLARSNKFSTPFWAKRNPTRHQGRLATITTVGDSRLTVSFDDNQPGSFVDYKVALLLPPRGTASYASNEYDILWTDNEGHITPLERNRIVDHLTRALGAAILRRLGISFVLLIHLVLGACGAWEPGQSPLLFFFSYYYYYYYLVLGDWTIFGNSILSYLYLFLYSPVLCLVPQH
jgi:hypothetical protein